MIDYSLITAAVTGIGILLILILIFRIQAFIALLISSICVGLIAGMPANDILKTIQDGMGNTLGFVALVVGLGGMFGAILEHSGGAESVANHLLKTFGIKNAPWAMVLTGFIIAIPVFFDVAFIILIPLVYALQQKTKKSLLFYAIPLLAGLAITHAFIPPTPGPIAVADILEANLGWVIVFGVIVGIPTAIISGPIFGKYISSKIVINSPIEPDTTHGDGNTPPINIVLLIISFPIILIIAKTIITSPFIAEDNIPLFILGAIKLIGHPFVALLLANILVWYFLGIRRGTDKEKLLEITTKSMGPAGMIILLTGAGGVFKQMLINTGTGEMLANYFSNEGFNIIIFAFLTAGIVRVMQGSSTVAMITAAGIVSAMIPEHYSEIQKALTVIAIAAGSSILSHVNDSGFWLVSKYLNLNEKQTFASWSVMTSILGLTAIVIVYFLSLLST